jgi:hypothetical protein
LTAFDAADAARGIYLSKKIPATPGAVRDARLRHSNQPLGRHPRQQKSLQTVFFNAVIGSSDVAELPLSPRGAASAVTLRPFFFGDLSAITMAQ